MMINSNYLKSLLLVSLVIFTGQVSAKDNSATNRAHAVMQEFFDGSGTPGLSVSVGLGDAIVWSEGFGYADLEQGVKVDPARTRFRIGSVIKSMTAFAAAQLVDAGKLDLEVPIQTYVPDFPEKRGTISTRQLLGHLSGIRHYGAGEFFSREHYGNVTAGLVIFKDDPLLGMPGDAYQYSSYGYNLASAVIESAAGQDYLLYMVDHVFKPLGMENTVPDYLAQITPGRGRYYYRDDAGNVLNAPEVDNSYKWASGGVVGTSNDLVRFGLAQLAENFISDTTRKMFWTEQTTNSGETTGYGLGWRIITDETGSLWIGHTGGSVGGTTSFWILPEHELVIAAISNLSSFNYDNVLVTLKDIFTDQ